MDALFKLLHVEVARKATDGYEKQMKKKTFCKVLQCTSEEK